MKEHPEDPKDDGTKVPGATYAWMIPVLARVGRRHGYAMAIHGSMSRDLDVVAAPWVDDANEPDALVDDICKTLNGYVVLVGEKRDSRYEAKSHGRKAYTIVFIGAWHFIDLSVMPKTT